MSNVGILSIASAMLAQSMSRFVTPREGSISPRPARKVKARQRPRPSSDRGYRKRKLRAAARSAERARQRKEMLKLVDLGVSKTEAASRFGSLANG